ncbi:MAG: transposase [Verrucomicrobia bacterium]|nr:transposase [Verrucomicrobiota bacterium]
MKPVSQVSQPSHLVSGFHTRNTLPHLKREGGTYFVTFRLADTLPAELIRRLKAERAAIVDQARAAKRPLTWHEQEELFRWYSSRVDAFLDTGRGECFLGRPEIADVVAGALRHFDGQRYELRAWSVMPNHVHAVVWPKPPHTLSRILHSWKSFTATQANRMLDCIGRPFWQKEAYDHLVRDDADLARCCEYTTMNPVNAKLCEWPEDWKWSSLFRPTETRGRMPR